MKKLSSLLTMLLLSTGAHAAQQLSYNGHLISDAGSFHAGDAFSGQFTFNPDSPDLSAYQTPPNVSRPRIELTYLNNYSSSVAINGGQPIIGNYKIEVHFENDLALTQDMINSIGLQGRIAPGTYDTADISDTSHNPSWTSATTFYVMALFAQDTFTATEIQNQNYQSIFGLNLNPVFLAFRVLDRSSNAVSTGVIEN